MDIFREFVKGVGPGRGFFEWEKGHQRLLMTMESVGLGPIQEGLCLC